MASINNFVQFEDVEDKKDETILLIDGHNIAYITVFSTISSDYTDNGVFVLWKHAFISRIFNIIKTLNPTKVILAFDTKGSWRYDVYEQYKANRKKTEGKKPLNKEAFMVALNDMIDTFKNILTNIYTIHADECEGDDIIAVLAKEFNKQNEQVIIVSGDTDLNQLLVQSNVRQYDPRKSEFFNVINPKLELQIKILSGDTSDNISPIKKGVGVKTAEKILKSPNGLDGYIEELETDLEKKTITENFKRNKQLIDLEYIPKRISNRILEKYKQYNIKELDGKRVINFFMKNKLHDLRTKWGIIYKYIKILK